MLHVLLCNIHETSLMLNLSNYGQCWFKIILSLVMAYKDSF